MKRMVAILATLCLLCAALPALATPEIIVPDAYTQTGTLPIYRATAQDMGKNLQPTLFNTSGIASQDTWNITFTDGATLSWAPEALFYNENSGTFDANAGTGQAASYCPLPALSAEIAGLASWAMSGWPGDGKVYTLGKTALTHITLDAAKATLETLLSQLSVTGYACDAALDMAVDRIHLLGADMNAQITAGEFYTNIPQCDFSKATTADEGFSLRYLKPEIGLNEGSGSYFNVYAYVTVRGVVYLALRELYIPGAVSSTPEALVSPESVLERLPQEAAAGRFATKVVTIQSIRLSYAPMRAANKADGMVLSPIWLVLYQDEESQGQGYTSWAEFDAVDGKLLNAMFK